MTALLTYQRIERLARVLEMVPGPDGCWLHKSDNRWWLTGCIHGDQPLPQTHGCRTMLEAIDAAEAWLAPKIDANVRNNDD